MPLVKKVTRHGNSSGVILDQPILKQLGWEPGTEVEVKVEGDTIGQGEFFVWVMSRVRTMESDAG